MKAAKEEIFFVAARIEGKKVHNFVKAQSSLSFYYYAHILLLFACFRNVLSMSRSMGLEMKIIVRFRARFFCKKSCSR